MTYSDPDRTTDPDLTVTMTLTLTLALQVALALCRAPTLTLPVTLILSGTDAPTLETVAVTINKLGASRTAEYHPWRKDRRSD